MATWKGSYYYDDASVWEASKKGEEKNDWESKERKKERAVVVVSSKSLQLDLLLTALFDPNCWNQSETKKLRALLSPCSLISYGVCSTTAAAAN